LLELHFRHSESFGRHSDPESCEGEESQDKPCGEFIESIREESPVVKNKKLFRFFGVAEQRVRRGRTQGFCEKTKGALRMTKEGHHSPNP